MRLVEIKLSWPPSAAFSANCLLSGAFISSTGTFSPWRLLPYAVARRQAPPDVARTFWPRDARELESAEITLPAVFIENSGKDSLSEFCRKINDRGEGILAVALNRQSWKAYHGGRPASQTPHTGEW